MMKHMKKAVSFFMAVCLLAGNSYVGGTSTSVTITPIVQAEETVAETADTQEEKSGTFIGSIFDTVSTWTGNLADRIRTASAEETTEKQYRYVLDLTGQRVEDKSVTAKMENSTVIASLNRVDQDDNSDTSVIKSVKFSSWNEEAITVGYGEAAGLNPLQVRLSKKGPGWATIQAEIVEEYKTTDANGNEVTAERTVYFTATFLVSSEVDRREEVWVNVGEANKILVLDPTKLENNSYQLKFYDIENSEDISDCVEFETPYPAGIISVSEDGLIEIVGAGEAKLSINNYADVTITDGTTERVTVEKSEIKVIVLPTGRYDKVEFSTQVNATIPPVAGESGSDFIFYTNALDAANTLEWEVYKVNPNGTLGDLIDPEDTSLISYTFDEDKICFYDVKAGTYRVKAKVKMETAYPETIVPSLVFDVVVKLNLVSKEIYVNVGDYYDIVANSNIPEGRFDLFSPVPDPLSEVYAVTDRTTGLITALTYGTQKVTLAYNNVNGIYTDEEAESIGTITYTIHVIDTLSISPSSAVMYTGGEMTLKANTTQHGTIYWEVSEADQKYITVSNNGVVKAHAKTPDNYEATVVAYQIIGGVTKRAECKLQVYETAASIELSPTEIEIAIGETKTIEAILTPSNLNSLNLRWQSMNEEVFTIGSEIGDTSIQIVGKAAGTATLIVINEDNGEMGYCEVTVKQPTTGLKISETKITGLEKETYQLQVEVLPETATNKEVLWWSVDTSIATVDQTGKVTFKKEGTTVICVRSVDDPTLQATCTVVVSKMLSGIKLLEDTELEMYVGQTHIVGYKITPDNASDKTVIWESFNTKVATVDADGKITAKSPGTALIMIMSKADPSIYKMITVTVKQKATSVKMNYKEVTMNRGEYFDMEVTIAPTNSTEASLIWESLNTKVVTVSSTGRLTARAEGTAIVLVRTESGVTSYCTVTVLEPVTSLELDPTDIVIEVGEVFAIDPVFKPAEPSNVEVKWQSYDTSIATVNALGEVTGVSRGSTVITCESVDGGYRAFCMVTVVNPDIVITINPDNYRLGYGKTFTLEATVTNHGKTVDNVELIWSSSDDSICSVDQNGKIYGEDFGYATITVTLDEDEYDIFATCEVRVVREVTSIKLNHTVLTIIKGHTASLNADVQPSNATYTDVTYTSDDEAIAVIDEDGVITALEVGSTWIWAKAKDNSGKYARCWVTVINPIPATGITVSDKQIVLLPGESKQMTFTIKPTNSTDDITWTSGEESIATVDGNGKVTAHRIGTTTVTAMTTSGKTAQIEVIVLGMSRSTLEIPVYTQYSRLYVDGATGTVRWDVEDTTICEVSNGVITARKVGTTYVTATVNGRTLRCKVTVTANSKKK